MTILLQFVKQCQKQRFVLERLKSAAVIYSGLGQAQVVQEPFPTGNLLLVKQLFDDAVDFENTIHVVIRKNLVDQFAFAGVKKLLELALRHFSVILLCVHIQHELPSNFWPFWNYLLQVVSTIYEFN